MTDTYVRVTYRGQQFVMTEEELDDMADDVMDGFRGQERRQQFELTKCGHCRRTLRSEPYIFNLCKRCVKLDSHDAENRLLRAIFDEGDPCERCEVSRVEMMAI